MLFFEEMEMKEQQWIFRCLSEMEKQRPFWELYLTAHFNNFYYENGLFSGVIGFDINEDRFLHFIDSLPEEEKFRKFWIEKKHKCYQEKMWIRHFIFDKMMEEEEEAYEMNKFKSA